MIIIEPPAADSIMVVAAHPDDIESWCAGTLARAPDADATVRLLLVTSGERGTNDPAAAPQAIAARREAEARTAAGMLGIADVAFLHHPDGDVEDTKVLRGQLTEWIRRWQPEILFTHDPDHPLPAYISHRDHRIVGRATLDAVYPLARDPLAFPEQIRAGLTAHAVRHVWLFASAVAHVIVDISATFDIKIAARLAHESQTADPVALPSAWRARAATAGAAAGVPVADAFTVLTLE